MSSGSSSRPLISAHPEELTFHFELEKQCNCELKIVNNTEHHVAFKVKTTSPKKYFVRPNTGILQPWDSFVVTVTLQAQQEYPPDMQCKDKFLLQSTKVPPTNDIDEIPQDTFNKEAEKVIEECKLKVVYTIPSDSAHGSSASLIKSSVSKSLKQSSETASMHISSSFDDAPALMRLKEEWDSALQESKQLQQELEMLKRHRNRKGDAGFSLIFAAFVGVVGVILGFLLNLALSAPPTE